MVLDGRRGKVVVVVVKGGGCHLGGYSECDIILVDT